MKHELQCKTKQYGCRKLLSGGVWASPSDRRASTIFCTCIWKQKLLWKEPGCSFSLLTTRPGRCRSALNVWNFHWAGSGLSSINAGTCPGWLTRQESIRGYQLLLSHLGRQPSSEVLRGALLSLRLLSHLASQVQLNGSSMLLTPCIGKYILLNAWFCRPRMYQHCCKFSNFAVWSHFLPISLGNVICCPGRKSLSC